MRRRVIVVAITSGLIGGCQKHEPPVRADDLPSPVAPAVAPDRAPVAARGALPEHGVAGVVISEDGAPIEGARVCAWTKRPPLRVVRDEMFSPICSDSNPRGGYALELGAGAWRVVASAPGREPEHQNVVLRRSNAPAQILDLTLAPGGRLQRGRVLDTRGQPIAGAQVTANLYVGFPERGFVQTQTGADGSFELWTNRYSHLWFLAKGHAREFVVRQGEDYVLIPESVVRGLVVDRKGAPVAGARVAVREPYSLYGEREHATWTDARGEFELTAALPGEHSIAALTDDALGFATVDLDYAQTRDGVEIRLEPSPRLRLRVSEPGVGPVALCGIDVAPQADPDDLGERLWTDEEGSIDVPLQAKRYRIAGIECRGKVGVPPSAAINLRRDVSLELELAPGRTLRARVLAQNGQPIAHEQLWLKPAVRSNGIDPGKAETDAEGRFELTGLTPGTYAVGGPEWMWFPGMPSVVITDAPITEAEITLPASGRVELRSNVAQWDQYGRITKCEPSGAGWSDNERSDGHGRVVFEHVPVGEHVVSFDQTPYCSREQLPRLDVRDGDQLMVEIAVEPPATKTILVHVEDPAGQPIHGALVQIDDGSSSSIVAGSWESLDRDGFAVSDADGVARLVIKQQTSIMRIEALAPGLAGRLSAYGDDEPSDDEPSDEEDGEEDGEAPPELAGTEFTLRLHEGPARRR